MSIELPDLPYPRDALQPHMSKETLDYHYGKHHAGYVKKLNKALEKKDLDMPLEELIRTQSGGVFNNAAQVWNHTFFWHCLSPDGGGEPGGPLADDLKAAFGSVQEFRDKFTAKAKSNFGSGWTWLVQNASGELEIVNTDDADTPVRDGSKKPLLTVDVWEHAYYLDHRNDRGAYLDAFWKMVNWPFVASNRQ